MTWDAMKVYVTGVAGMIGSNTARALLEAGHVVMSGSFIKAIPFHAGDTVSALFNELGEVGFRATE